MAKKTNADGSILLTLEKPFKYGDREISEVTIKSPKGKALRGIDLQKLQEYDNLSKLIVSSSDIESTAMFDEMEMVDIMGCFDVIADFLPDSPETGKPS